MKNELPEYTIDEIKERNGDDGKPLWVIIRGKVYDMTTFAHPGGKDTLKDEHGTDREDEFYTIHSKGAIDKSKEFLIGKVKNSPEQNNVNESKKVKQSNPTSKAGIFAIALGLVFYVFVFKLNLFGLFNRKN